MATAPPVYYHAVVAVFDPGAERGFVYTSGLACEFFALDVPVHLVSDVAGTMNFLSKRAVCANHTCQEAGGQLYRMRAVDARRRTQLMRSHLKQITPGAAVLQLVPIGGWVEVVADAKPFVSSCACGGPGCAFCH